MINACLIKLNCYLGDRNIMDKDNLLAELKSQGITNKDVLKAISLVPREAFVPKVLQAQAYENKPLPIGSEQTISQPYIVALMTELAMQGPATPKKVLEIGTGSGYQAAVLSLLVEQVYSIERLNKLYQNTSKLLASLSYKNIKCLYGDGNQGFSEHSPYDVILITAATEHIAKDLLDQLASGGRLIVPKAQKDGQVLQVITKREHKLITEDIISVRFVPLLPGKS